MEIRYGYFEEQTEAEKIRSARDEWRMYGLAIFESFEEYMLNREEEENG